MGGGSGRGSCSFNMKLVRSTAYIVNDHCHDVLAWWYKGLKQTKCSACRAVVLSLVLICEWVLTIYGILKQINKTDRLFGSVLEACWKRVGSVLETCWKRCCQ